MHVSSGNPLDAIIATFKYDSDSQIKRQEQCTKSTFTDSSFQAIGNVKPVMVTTESMGSRGG